MSRGGGGELIIASLRGNGDGGYWKKKKGSKMQRLSNLHGSGIALLGGRSRSHPRMDFRLVCDFDKKQEGRASERRKKECFQCEGCFHNNYETPAKRRGLEPW